ncbi:gamma-glutamyl hydrolase-like isoform X1 [Amblyraja radiata]|uniref:gamma-glutamyl hydrolase-like isoform X1 n=2 Tax=Amblyraja radiata TaxID=386614 RepID=UPI00140316E8|nr:gamma-glutamyl hydrolase-like isoform X1 [Amblyraja radiata]
MLSGPLSYSNYLCLSWANAELVRCSPWSLELLFRTGTSQRLIAAMNGHCRATTLNERPIIGILAQHTDDDLAQEARTYVASTYVKYLESAGCRVAVIRLYLGESEYEKLFNSINGILLPGGAVDLQTSEFARVAGIIYRLAIQAGDRDDYFPVWGTCMGHQLLTALTSGQNLLRLTDSGNVALPLHFTPETKSCRMFRDFPPELMRVLAENPLTGHFHKYSLTLEAFEANEKLHSFYRLISTNTDPQGITFVSTMEALQYPIYGTQWHPEANRFFWKESLDAPHCPLGVRMSYLLADFFVNEARRNLHRFASKEEEESALIDQHTPRFLGDRSSYRSVYLFD